VEANGAARRPWRDRSQTNGASDGPAQMPVRPIRLVVLGDSFAFTDHRGPQPPDDPALFPNIAAQDLAELTARPVETTVLARPGTSVRDVWQLVSKDRHAQFDVLGRADAVVVAVGSFDHTPTGLPRPLTSLVPYVRPAGLRRRVRRTLHRTHPWLVIATAGQLPLTPTAEFARLYDLVLRQVRGLRPGVAGVALGPSGHRSWHYARRNPHLRRREDLQMVIARRHGFPLVRARPVAEAYLDRLNEDGIHWPHEVHAGLGRALAERLADQLTGRVPTPPNPWDELEVGAR
jgi:diglucosylglycerate octanoyltransferase